MNAPALPLEFGRSLFARLQQNIVDNMPTGSHQARADGWRKLARRCDAAADAHAALVMQRQETRRIVQSFAPAYRQAALDALARGTKIEVPGGYSNIEPDMCVEDFRALCEEEAQKAERARADAKLTEMTAAQQAKQAGIFIPWDEALIKLDALQFTAIPGTVSFAVEEPPIPERDDPDAWYAAEVERLKDRGPA